MEKEKDPDRIFKFEKAISDKYGKDTIASPKSNWTQEKEREYLSILKQQFHEKKQEQVTIEKHNGFSLKRNLFIREKRICSCCETYSFEKHDDLYLNKFDVCRECYVKYIDGREERWEKGWRPNRSK